MQKITTACTAAFLSVLLAACATAPGDKPADNPPRLMKNGEKTYWDNAGAFGPVPASMNEQAVKSCAALDDDKLIWKPYGFHPRALDLQGKPFASGGLLCKSEKKPN